MGKDKMFGLSKGYRIRYGSRFTKSSCVVTTLANKSEHRLAKSAEASRDFITGMLSIFTASEG
jgi:hypothetical protein